MSVQSPELYGKKNPALDYWMIAALFWVQLGCEAILPFCVTAVFTLSDGSYLLSFGSYVLAPAPGLLQSSCECSSAVVKWCIAAFNKSLNTVDPLVQ